MLRAPVPLGPLTVVPGPALAGQRGVDPLLAGGGRPGEQGREVRVPLPGLQQQLEPGRPLLVVAQWRPEQELEQIARWAWAPSGRKGGRCRAGPGRAGPALALVPGAGQARARVAGGSRRSAAISRPTRPCPGARWPGRGRGPSPPGAPGRARRWRGQGKGGAGTAPPTPLPPCGPARGRAGRPPPNGHTRAISRCKHKGTVMYQAGTVMYQAGIAQGPLPADQPAYGRQFGRAQPVLGVQVSQHDAMKAAVRRPGVGAQFEVQLGGDRFSPRLGEEELSHRPVPALSRAAPSTAPSRAPPGTSGPVHSRLLGTFSAPREKIPPLAVPPRRAPPVPLLLGTR